VAAYAVAHDDAGRILLCHISPAVGVGDVWTLPAEHGAPPPSRALGGLISVVLLGASLIRCTAGNRRAT